MYSISTSATDLSTEHPPVRCDEGQRGRQAKRPRTRRLSDTAQWARSGTTQASPALCAPPNRLARRAAAGLDRYLPKERDIGHFVRWLLGSSVHGRGADDEDRRPFVDTDAIWMIVQACDL